MKLGFYLLGEKGYTSLAGFLETASAEAIAFVCIGQDATLTDDYSAKLRELCASKGVAHCLRKELADIDLEAQANYRFAIGWRWIIANDDNLIVLHDSPLPKYRGWAPMVNMLINHEPELAVTALLAGSEYDAGPIITQKRMAVNYPIKIADAIAEISTLYRAIIVELGMRLLAGEPLNATPQNDADASFSLWRDAEDYRIDWANDAGNIQRRVDALGTPYAGALAYAGERAVRFDDVTPLPDVQVEARTEHLGKIIFINDGLPSVVCGKGLLRIDRARFEDAPDAPAKFNMRTRFTPYPAPKA